MTTLNRLDLEFLLRQVDIGIDYSQLQNALDPSGVREVAGTNNNLVGYDTTTNTPGPNSGWGAADEEFLRLSQTVDRTGIEESGTITSYGGTNYGGNVTDTSPRIISNLVSNMYTDGAYANPATIAAVETWGGTTADVAVDPNGTAFIPNVGPLGGSSYNSWFVFFGQFFDHGLDFIKKAGSGTITIPILESDPLYVPGGPNVMQISRTSLANPASDYDNGDPTTGNLIVGTTPVYLNNTGLSIDQSQTYGSHATINAFLREYDENGVATGRLVAGNTQFVTDGDPTTISNGLATWADIKLNALRIGITLEDSDVLDAPELETDAKGEIVRDPMTGLAQLTGQTTGQAFLLDMNPAANPAFAGITRTADADAVINDPKVPDFVGPDFTYDDELLDAHYITGDGRTNENFALTSVHHVWHEEHNFQVENIKQSILDDAAALGDTAFLAEWLVPGADPTVAPELLQWDGEKIFQAARAITETEYNHVAVDEYIGRLIPDLPEFVSYSSDINMAVSLEFSQSVFRLGHSMLTEELDIVLPDGTTMKVPLLDAFLNPEGFAEYGAAGIAEGAIKQLANEVDEFVTPALQQSLLGQPLDLAAINIARGRDVGLPTWNELRQQIFDGLIENTNNTNGGALAPYGSWAEVGAHLRNPESLVNLIAAYARDGDIKAARDAGDIDEARSVAALRMADQDFMQGTPTYDPGTGQWTVGGDGLDLGFWDIDLWVGGLAERPLIDGVLGTTFSFVFLDFAQRMQDGDRFYYLFRMPPGSSIGEQIIATKFSDIISRNTGVEGLNGDSFAYADRYFTPDGDTLQYFTEDTGNFYFNAATALLDDADPTSIAADGHIVISGGAGNDNITAGNGDDTVHGGDGNDFINGSQGNDTIFGGAGNDLIIDDENDDFIRGGTGDDIVFAGKGALDTVFGEEGNDELHGGDGIDEVFGGEGDDALFGDGDTDVIVGGEGNDYIEGGDSVDEMWGGDGNDIIIGGVGDDHLNGDGGNDLLFGGLGAAANDGDRLLGDALLNQAGVFPRQEGGFGDDPPGTDIASYENVGIAITADLQTSNQNGTGSTLIDSYAFIDGLVGSQFDDNLTGADEDTTTSNGIDNLLVGGAGNDILTGLGGDDFIAGDWVVVDNDLQVAANQDKSTAIVDSHGLNRIDVGDITPAGHLDEAHLGHVLGDNATAGAPETGDADVAVFSGDFDDYTITDNGDGTVQVVDNREIDSTAVGDTLKDIEIIRFADGDRTVREILNRAPVLTGSVMLNDLLVNTSVVITLAQLLENATDPDMGDVLAVENLVASSGMLVDNTDGTWTFTPDPNDDTEVTFTYDVTDGLASVAQTAALDLVPFPGNAIVGTPDPDLLFGTPGNDTIDALGGADMVFAQAGNDIVNGGDGDDKIFGGAGDDIIFGGADNDMIFGEDGNDTIFGEGGNDMIFGGEGVDVIDGGAGADQIFGQIGGDIVDGGDGSDIIWSGEDNDTILGGQGADFVNAGTGDDIVVATLNDGNDSYFGDSGNDTYDLSGTTANATVDLAAMSASSTQTGMDTLIGFENAIGGFGNDTLLASDAVNLLTGGAGNDDFVFRTIQQAGTSEATRDQITDFQPGDRIDLSAIDADVVDGGNQSFELVFDKPTFTEAGQVMFRHEQQADGEHTILEGNVDGDDEADFQIDIAGRHDLTASDFTGVA